MITDSHRQVLVAPVVEEEKSDNIHDATKIVLRKSNANNGNARVLALGHMAIRSLQEPSKSETIYFSL